MNKFKSFPWLKIKSKTRDVFIAYIWTVRVQYMTLNSTSILFYTVSYLYPTKERLKPIDRLRLPQTSLAVKTLRKTFEYSIQIRNISNGNTLNMKNMFKSWTRQMHYYYYYYYFQSLFNFIKLNKQAWIKPICIQTIVLDYNLIQRYKQRLTLAEYAHAFVHREKICIFHP